MILVVTSIVLIYNDFYCGEGSIHKYRLRLSDNIQNDCNRFPPMFNSHFKIQYMQIKDNKNRNLNKKGKRASQQR